MQILYYTEYEDTHTHTHKKKSIYRPGDTKKTVRLSSQLSPANIFQKQTRTICKERKKLKKRKKKKSTKTNKGNMYWTELKVYSRI